MNKYHVTIGIIAIGILTLQLYLIPLAFLVPVIYNRHGKGNY